MNDNPQRQIAVVGGGETLVSNDSFAFERYRQRQLGGVGRRLSRWRAFARP